MDSGDGTSQPDPPTSIGGTFVVQCDHMEPHSEVYANLEEKLKYSEAETTLLKKKLMVLTCNIEEKNREMNKIGVTVQTLKREKAIHMFQLFELEKMREELDDLKKKSAEFDKREHDLETREISIQTEENRMKQLDEVMKHVHEVDAEAQRLQTENKDLRNQLHQKLAKVDKVGAQVLKTYEDKVAEMHEYNKKCQLKIVKLEAELFKRGSPLTTLYNSTLASRAKCSRPTTSTHI